MSKSAIDDWIKTISKMIKVSYEVGASVSDHSTILGDARESFIRDILEKFLPSSISIGSGQIIDQNGKRSKQVESKNVETNMLNQKYVPNKPTC